MTQAIPIELLQRGMPSDQVDVVEGVLRQLDKRGFDPTEECMRILVRALRFAGRPYEREEEFSDATIDCSTLTSQSHWEGALVGIPFIAEGQRLARTGTTLDDVAHALPGDVVVKYPSLAHTPDGIYNHVGLFLGGDPAGVDWIVESTSGVGVRVSRLTDFDPAGGIKRFAPHPRDTHDGALVEAALGMALLVPKLGRQGARQYTVDSDDRFPHTGVDVYCAAGTTVRAPISGKVTVTSLEREDAVLLEITTDDGSLVCGLGQVECGRGLVGRKIDVGERLGIVIPPSPRSRIRYVEATAGMCHLHFELRTARKDTWEFVNPLYLCKQGKVELPLPASLTPLVNDAPH